MTSRRNLLKGALGFGGLAGLGLQPRLARAG